MVRFQQLRLLSRCSSVTRMAFFPSNRMGFFNVIYKVNETLTVHK